MKYQVLTLLLASLVLWPGCKKDDNDCFQGNGDIVQDSRPLSDYNAVTANGAFEISYSQLNNNQVDLYGDSNILPLIRTNVLNNRLIIDTDDNTCYSTDWLIEAYLSSPVISDFLLNGATKVTANGIQQDEIHFTANGTVTLSASMDVNMIGTTINGSGDANLSGTADNAEMTISGSGNIFASTLNTQECTIVITGAGDVRIHVEQTLNVTISGSGSVYYSGNPENVNSNITGSGTLVNEG